MNQLIPFGGFGRLSPFRRDFDDLFDGFFGKGFPALRDEEAFFPKVDVKETDAALEFHAELPGLKPKEVEVSLSGDILTIKGEKKFEHEDEGEHYHVVERRSGSFSRSFRIPFEVDHKKLNAVHKDGVLKIVLPKKEKEAPTTIEVKGE